MATRTLPIDPNNAPNSHALIVKFNDFQTKLRNSRSIGRPKLDPSVFMDELVDRLTYGESLLSICNHSGNMPSYEWVTKLAVLNPPLFKAIDDARTLGTEALFDLMQDIASGGEYSTGDIHRDRLLIDVIWRTIRMRNPNKYGDKISAASGIIIVARPSSQDGLDDFFG